MQFLAAAVLAGAMIAASSAAFAQSGYDTGARKPTGTTTNSGPARPDATRNGGGAPAETSSRGPANAASSSGAGGERGQRPDAKPASTAGAPKASSNSRRAAPTQVDD
jgi:hypothetical protein